jgi:hypothetical protein
MSTTALFIELLITGVQAAIWLTLFILCLLGFDWINPERLKGFEVLLAVILLPIVYPAGVFIDNLADRLFRPWELKIREAYNLKKTQTALTLLMRTKDQSLASHFSYIRSRIRISRSSAFNFALMTIASVPFTVARLRSVPKFPFWRTLLLEILVGFSLTALAALAWRQINHSFFKWIVRGYDINSDISGAGTIEEAVLAASLSEANKEKKPDG